MYRMHYVRLIPLQRSPHQERPLRVALTHRAQLLHLHLCSQHPIAQQVIHTPTLAHHHVQLQTITYLDLPLGGRSERIDDEAENGSEGEIAGNEGFGTGSGGLVAEVDLGDVGQ